MLALWEFNWTVSDWTGVAPTPAPAVPEMAQGGGARGRQRIPYSRADDDFWEVRERYLRRFAKKYKESMAPAEPIESIDSTPTPEVSNIDRPAGGRDAAILLQQAMDAALARAEHAADAIELRDAMQRVNSLYLDISHIHQQNYNRAIVLLLLDAF